MPSWSPAVSAKSQLPRTSCCPQCQGVGTALRRIRELTHDYQAPADGCASFKALYDGLASLESDLHRHIHKENNILFPKAAALESALMSAGA